MYGLKKMQHNDLLSLIKKKEKEQATFQAFIYFSAHNFAKVIELLTPFYNPLVKPDLEIINLLATSYVVVAKKSENEIAYSLWKILYKEAKNKLEERDKSLSPKMQHKTYNNHPKDAVIALTHMARFTDNPSLCNLFVAEGIKLAEKYPKSFIGNPPMPSQVYYPVEDKSYLASTLYTLCYNAATRYNNILSDNNERDESKHKSEIDAVTLHILQKKSFQESAAAVENALKYYKLALIYKPNDLMTLCFLTCLMATAQQDSAEALRFFLGFKAIFKENPLFYYAIYKLYSYIRDEIKAGYYYNKFTNYSKNHTPDKKLISILDQIKHPSNPNQISIDSAVMACNAKNYLEAKNILTALLQDEPGNYMALELTACTEHLLGNLARAIEICDNVLAINPKSALALRIKAVSLWDYGDLIPNAQVAQLCEQYFQYGYRKPSMLRMLMIFYENENDYGRMLKYAVEYSLLESSAEVYFIIAVAQIELFQYAEAIIALRKVRALDENYLSNEVSAGIIYCSFKLARSIEDYKKCSKKITSYLAHLGSSPRNENIDMIISELQKLDIVIHETVVNDTLVSKPQAVDLERSVPVEIKNSVNAAMKRIGRFSIKDEPIDNLSDKPTPTPKIKSDKLVSMNESGTIKGYIDPDAGLTDDDFAKFQTALETGRLLTSDSKNLSGIKKSKKSGWKIKIMGSGMRLKSAIVFFKPREGKLNKFDTIIEFGRLVRKHD